MKRLLPGVDLLKPIVPEWLSGESTGWIDKVLAFGVRRPTSIVILGFWRSGTTFLMEQVARETGFRSFFEPLHYSVPRAQAHHPPMQFDVAGKCVTQWIPFRYRGEADAELRRLISAALRGSLSTPWTRRRRGPLESLSRHTVVKFVRANLIGAWIQSEFRVKPVWVVRHPGAVLASIVRRQGGAPALRTILGDPRLLRWVLKQPGVRRHFPDVRDAWAVGDDAGPDEVILRLWMVMHWIPWRLYRLGEWSPTIVPYAGLVTDRDSVARIVAERGLRRSPLSRRHTRRADSSTTKSERKGVSVEERIHGWRREVSAESRQSIDRLLGCFDDDFASWVDSMTG